MDFREVSSLSHRRIALFVDIFPPSMGGGATRASCIVQSLLALGCHVTVVTTSCIYPVGNSIISLKFIEEKQENLTIIRVPSLNLPFKGLLNRMLNYSASSLSMLLIAPKLKNFDLIFSIGMHPFTDLAAYFIKRIYKSRFIVDISDLFPENSLFTLLNHALNRLLLRLSDSISLHNERLCQIFRSRYNCHKQILILHNSVDTTIFKPNLITRKNKTVLSALCGKALSSTIVICYFGVFGPLQGLQNILNACSLINNEKNNLTFIFIGDGEEKSKLYESSKNLNNVIFLPKMNRETIVQVAAEVDVGLVPLVSTDPLVVYINLPSKAAEFLSSGVPILAAKGTFIGYLTTKWAAGFEVNFSEIDELCKILRLINSDYAELVKSSENARLLALNVFSLEVMQRSLMRLF